MDTHDEIQSILEELLHKIHIEYTIERSHVLGGVCFEVHTPDGGVLIGENGQNLFALYYLLRRITDKRFGDAAVQFSLDVNDYQKKKVEEVKERARMGAQRVRYFKKEVVMQPMSAFERRIIHMTLAEDPDIVTESRGEGETRCVVIKPAQI